MARRYVSRSRRRFSVSSGEETVDRNQDLEGRGAGGAEPTVDVREVWRARKSE